MSKNIFIPEKMKIGFYEESGNFTNKTALLVPMEYDGSYRKDKRFSRYSEEELGTMEVENMPMTGFSLLKSKDGSVSRWGKYNYLEKILIFDPRGFEFDISLKNLLFILEQTDMHSIEGAELAYGWYDNEFLLLPTQSEDYKESFEKSLKERKRGYITPKELIVGATYMTKENLKLIYLGRFNEYYYQRPFHVTSKKSVKPFYFACVHENQTFDVYTLPNIKHQFVEVLEETEHVRLNEFMAYLETQTYFSPVDNKQTVVEDMSFEFFEELLRIESNNFTRDYFHLSIVAMNGETYFICPEETSPFDQFYFTGEKDEKSREQKHLYNGKIYEYSHYKDIFNILKPSVTHYFQENGRHYKSESHPF